MAEKKEDVSIPVKTTPEHTVTLKPEGEGIGMQAASRVMKGELPTNVQVTTGLEQAQRVVDQGEVETRHGQAIQEDIKEVIEDVKRITEDKNRDEAAQKAFHHAKEAAKAEGGAVREQARSREEHEKMREMRHELSDMAIALRRLARNLVWDSELRQSGMDILDLLEGIFIRVRVEKKEGKLKPAATPTPEQEGTGGEVERPTAATRKGTFLGGRGLTEEVSEPVQAPVLPPTAQQPVTPQPTTLQPTTPQPTTGETLGEQREPTVADRFVELTKEKKDELRAKMKHMLVRLGAHEDFKVAVEDSLSLFDYMKDSMRRHREGTKDKPVVEHMDQCWQETKVLLERFARKSLDPTVDHTNQMMNSLRNDPQVNNYFRDLRAMMLKYIRNPELLEREGEKADHEIDDIIERGRELMRNDERRNQIRWLMDDSRDTLIRIRDDPLVSKFQEDLTKLARDLLLNEQGRPSQDVLRDSLIQLRHMLAPSLSREMENIHFPRIEGQTKKYNYAVSNLRFSVKDLMPERLKMRFDTGVDIATKALVAPLIKTRLDVKLEDIDSYMEDVQFQVSKVGGLIKYEDWGTVNVDMRGARLHSKWTIDDKSNGGTWGFYADKTKVSIDRLRVTVKEAKHSVLDTLATKLFAGALRTRVETVLSNNLHKRMISLTRQLNAAIRDQYAKMKSQMSTGKKFEEGQEVGFGGPWPGWKNILKEGEQEGRKEVAERIPQPTGSQA